MNPEIKAQWTAALRSGEHKQTKGRLNRTEPNGDIPAGYCCLGVLCDIAEKAGVVTSRIIEHPGDLRGVLYYDDSFLVLPESVVAWSGVGDGNPRVRVPIGGSATLGELNDSYDYTFAQLADLIDAQL